MVIRLGGFAIEGPDLLRVRVHRTFVRPVNDLVTGMVVDKEISTFADELIKRPQGSVSASAILVAFQAAEPTADIAWAEDRLTYPIIGREA